MFGIGPIELTIIAIFAFLIFGPDKLPGVIKNVTHVWNQLKGLRLQADEVIKAEVVEPLKDIEATINPLASEGKSATDALAAKLGIKGDSKKKTEEKKQEEDAAKNAAGAAVAAAAGAVATKEAADASSTKETATANTDTAVKEVKPQAEPKLKTESFAEKKARLERQLREKQGTEGEAAADTSASAPASSATDSTTTTVTPKKKVTTKATTSASAKKVTASAKKTPATTAVDETAGTAPEKTAEN